MQRLSITVREQECVFQHWLRKHLGLMLKVVRGSASSPQDQDDLLQEVLLQVWLSIPAFRGEARETTWIYRVAFNTAMTWRRTERKRRVRHETFVKYDVSPQQQPSHLETQAEQELVKKLYGAIHQLPALDASLALMHLDGLSYQEMAEVLDISENYIGVKLNRIRKQLTEQLSGASNEL